MNKEIVFSVIIPHKNTPELLQRCLNSIPRRENIQIVAVDDNSDEDKVDFNNFPGLGDKFVEVYFTKEGKGAGYARNVGIEHAKGKWLLFADADDFFVENAFDIFDSHIDSEYKLICFNTICKYSNNLEKAHYRNEYIVKMLQEYVDCPSPLSLNYLKYRYVTVWAKMYNRKELIVKHSITFDEIPVSNDVMFSIYSAFYAGCSIIVLLEPVYCITYREGSLTTTKKRYDLFLCRYMIELKRNKFLREIKQYKIQTKIIAIILKSIRFGLEKPVVFLYLALKNKNNPFILNK